MEMKRRQKHISLRCSNQGFTMVELLVAMVVALLAMGAIYSTFLNQQKSYVVQGETAAMHQNIRAAMFYMQREIRMAGCDPTSVGGFGITAANANSITFTEDVNGGAPGTLSDGVITATTPGGDANDEIITYILDMNRNLMRDAGSGNQMVAQNIDAIDFVYLDGVSPPNVLNPGGINVPGGSLDQIRSVEITIVARTDRNTLASPNNNAYFNQRNFQILSPKNDNFSRRRLTTSIKCRNLGL
ncbi:MAG: prepilin-type N-terminal cleavage/methylation domain-containing protein [Desulfobacterales bacterium]|nr:prepilin-type N-terminal cleavage/methylation domain-containing protein [Desulfobacterales bacterium]